MKLFNVVGIDDLEGMTFCRCSTFDKAKRAMHMLEEEGFEDCLVIIEDKINIDEIEINNHLISL